MTYIFGDLGRCWSIFRDLGSKGKILLGSGGNYFQGSGEIIALFQGSREHRPPPWGGLKDKFPEDAIKIVSCECSGSVVECLTRDRGTAGSSLTGVTVLWSLSKTHLS